MKLGEDVKISNVAGIGPAAWGGDSQKISIHPAAPGHAAPGKKQTNNRPQNKIIQRRHPESDNEFTVIRTGIISEHLEHHSHHLHHLIHHRKKDHKATGDTEKKVHCRKHRMLHPWHSE